MDSNTISNPVCNFKLDFDLNKRTCLVNFGFKDAVNETDPVEVKAFGNALVAIMLKYYESFGDGLYLHTSFEAVRNGLLKNDNVGYVFGTKLEKMLKAGELSYQKVDEMSGRSGNVLYRIRFDMFDFFPSEVPYRAYDEDEPGFASHNRNALKAIRHLEVLQKFYAIGKNLLLTWYESDDAYFSGEKGLKVKYQLWQLGQSDPSKLEVLRNLVNTSIAGKKAYVAGRKVQRLENQAQDDSNPEKQAKAQARLTRIEERNDEWKVLASDGTELQHEDLIGKVIQLEVGSTKTVLPQQFTVDADNLQRILSSIRAARARIVFSDAPAQPAKSRKAPKGRNVPEIVK